MHIYRFRIVFEDQDEFLREVELRADQTFEDFFLAITSNLNLDQGMLSSFYTCDHKFRRRREISLVDINPVQHVEAGNAVLLMKDARLNDFVDDPHQRFMLVYDFINQWTFYIELVRILSANASHVYPRIHRSEGDTPRELLPLPVEFPEDDELVPSITFDEDVYDPEDLEAFAEEEPEFSPEEEDNNLEGFDEDKH